MKKFLFITLTIFIVLSCRKDDADYIILGDWYKKSIRIISGANGQILNEEPVQNCQAETYYKFKENYTYILSYCTNGLVTEGGTYTYDEANKTVNFKVEETQVQDNYQYALALFSVSETEMTILLSKPDYDNDGIYDNMVSVYSK